MIFLVVNLNWIHSLDYPVLSCIAQDILAVLGINISVEWLFSSSKHTFSDTCSSLIAMSTSKMVVVKEWLKKMHGGRCQLSQ